MGDWIFIVWGILFLACGIAGMVVGNRTRGEAVGSHLSKPFSLWYLIKHSVISAIVSIIVISIINSFLLKGDVWLIILFSLSCPVNFFVIKHMIQEEHEIWTKVFNEAKYDGNGNIITPDDDHASASNSSANAAEIESCPFTGRVLVDKDTSALGFNWPTKSTAFHILPNWTLKSENGRIWGWIDENGRIHNGMPAGGQVNPRATLSGGETNLKVYSSYVYDGNEKFGEIVSW